MTAAQSQTQSKYFIKTHKYIEHVQFLMHLLAPEAQVYTVHVSSLQRWFRKTLFFY